MIQAFFKTRRPRLLFYFCLLFLFVYFLAVYHGGTDSFILILDNLDSNISRNAMLSLDQYFLADAPSPHPFAGIPDSGKSRGFRFHFGSLFYAIFPAIYAFIFNEVIMRLAAFSGMYLLLSRHIFPREERGRIAVICGASLCFALLPFWPSGYLNIAGQPLVLYAFLNIRRTDHSRWNWVIPVMFPFYSSLVLAGFAICLMLAAIWVWDLFRNKKLNRPFFLALAIMSLAYIIANNKLIFTFLVQKPFVSHRKEFFLPIQAMASALMIAKNNFLRGHFHAPSLHFYIILPSMIAALILGFKKFRPLGRLTLLLLATNAVISLFFGLWGWFLPSLPDSVFIRGFQWQRLHYLHPLIWFIMFAISLMFILRRVRFGGYVVFSLLFLQVLYSLWCSYPFQERFYRSKMTFREFYSTHIFEEVKDYIGKPTLEYRIIAVGLHPAILHFNGFYTLDGYFPSYSLEYKRQFRKIIQKELMKNEKIRDYFDKWGSRCYLFSAELQGVGNIWFGAEVNKNLDAQIRNLEIDVSQIKNMGGEYVISAVEILNHKEIGIEFLRAFERTDSPWRIFLYKVNPQPVG